MKIMKTPVLQEPLFSFFILWDYDMFELYVQSEWGIQFKGLIQGYAARQRQSYKSKG